MSHKTPNGEQCAYIDGHSDECLSEKRFNKVMKVSQKHYKLRRYGRFLSIIAFLALLLVVYAMWYQNSLRRASNEFCGLLTFEDQYCEYKPTPKKEKKLTAPKTYVGEASWYDYSLKRDDQKCRSNDCYSMFHSTCASRDYPRESILKVTHTLPAKEEDLSKDRLVSVGITCRVNDYGPEECPEYEPDCEWAGRIIDLSSFAFQQLADLNRGILEVTVSEVAQP